jgi:hypothetical protein
MPPAPPGWRAEAGPAAQRVLLETIPVRHQLHCGNLGLHAILLKGNS